MSGKKFLGCFSFCGGLFGFMKGFLGALLCCCCCCCWNLTWRFCCFRWSCCWMLFFCLSPIRAVWTISRVSGDRPSEESNKLSVRNRVFYVNHVSLQLINVQATHPTLPVFAAAPLLTEHYQKTVVEQYQRSCSYSLAQEVHHFVLVPEKCIWSS